MLADRFPRAAPRLPGGRGYNLRKLAGGSTADPDALNVTLFRDDDRTVRGWFIGPLATVEGRPVLPYLAPSEQVHASVAVVRAIQAGQAIGCSVCLIDPDELWNEVWNR